MKAFYRIICYATVLLGIYHLTRFFIARRKVSIILYHDPAPDVFMKHLTFLFSHYNIISLNDFIKYLMDPSMKIPEYSLVITFDDGHQRNMELTDMLKKYNVPATIYLCSGIVNTTRKFWFKLDGVYSKKLKKMSHSHRLEYLQHHYGFTVTDNFSSAQRQALDLAEIKQMKTNVDFQSHTRFHPLLTTCGDAEAEEEILASKEELEKLLEYPVTHFAYPNGDYSLREIGMLEKAGYISGRTTDIGWNDRKTNPYRLKITGVSDTADLTMFMAELTGIPAYFYNLYVSGINSKSLQGLHVPEMDKQ